MMSIALTQQRLMQTRLKIAELSRVLQQEEEQLAAQIISQLGEEAGGQAMTTGQRIAQFVSALLSIRGCPIPTRELLRSVQNQGHVLGGRSPLATLSAHLSRSDELVPSRDGWHLLAWVENTSLPDQSEG